METTVPVKRSKSAPRRSEWLDEMQNELSRMWHHSPFARWTLPAWPGVTGFSPNIDMFERGKNIVIKTDLPGMSRDQIELRLEDGDLVICGERHDKEEVKEDDYYRMERSSGAFCRRIELPPGVNADDIRAKFEDGVLEIEMAKPVQPAPKGERIRIR
jgi:HSP20 family protein